MPKRNAPKIDADAKKTPPKIDSKNARSGLEKRHKPYWVKIASGISLGYRRNDGAGTWSVRAADGKGGNWIKIFAITDDEEEADNVNVLDFDQASTKAKKLARGDDSDADTDSIRPITVKEALDDYAADLKARGGHKSNAMQPRLHLKGTPLLLKPVSMLKEKELRNWRNGLVTVMKASSINRMCKALKACFNLAASQDDRISNAKAWRCGLAALPEPDDTESNLVLEDEQRRDIVSAAYAMSDEFGLYVEVHTIGARSGQIAKLNVGDLHIGSKPLLMMPPSNKGRNRKSRSKKPIPIAPSLTAKLKQAASGRASNQPLLLNEGGMRWNSGDHRHPFAEAAQAASLPEGATIYCLRHTAITRALLAGVPVRLVASSLDTSVGEIEKTYSKFIASYGDEQMRRAVFDVDAFASSNVVALVR